MTEVETRTIKGISFIVTRNNPGPFRTRRVIRLSSPAFDVVYHDGWGRNYNPDSSRKWAVVYPNSTMLNNKAGNVRTFGDFNAAIAAGLKAAAYQK